MTPTQRIVLAAASLASFVSFLDGTVVSVALRAIRHELGGGLATQQWVVDGYLVTLGALILVAGSLSDALGRVRVLRIGLIAFGVTSLAAGLAPTPEVLIGARLAQGVAGALLVPSSLALITSAFDGASRSRAIGVWTGATTGAMVIGPLLGGMLVDLATWRLVFLINVLPIAATLVLLVALQRRDDGAEAARPGVRVQVGDAVLCAAGLGAAVFALVEQPRLGWGDPRILIPLIGGVVLFAVFLARQRRIRDPLLPLDLFRARNFAAGNLATFAIYGALSLTGFVLAVYLQQGAGLSATAAGAALLPSTVLMIVFSSRVGGLAGRFGARWFMTFGPLIAAGGTLLLLTVRPASGFDYLTQVLPYAIVFGVGLTLTVSPLTSAILGAVDPGRSGVGSAVNNAVSRIGGLIAIALLAVIAGGELDLDGFRRAVVVGAVLLALGGLVSTVGIVNPSRSTVAT